jgi:uncharacterized membrane protein (UPF0127 family)
MIRFARIAARAVAVAACAAATAIAASAGAARAATPCPAPSATPDPVPVAIVAPKATLEVRVARTFETREYGLMCVKHLAPHSGMIFVFSGGDQPQPFWMKNTLIPLDMVWVRANGRVDSIAANVPATTTETPYQDIPRRQGTGMYVIELAAGEAAHAGLTPGTPLDLTRVGHAKD